MGKPAACLAVHPPQLSARKAIAASSHGRKGVRLSAWSVAARARKSVKLGAPASAANPDRQPRTCSGGRAALAYGSWYRFRPLATTICVVEGVSASSALQGVQLTSISPQSQLGSGPAAWVHAWSSRASMVGRSVAQPGSALASGARGREFESPRSDQLNQWVSDLKRTSRP
jgi:hypothetical protein